ncbi:MAG: hypothetical protein WCU00_04380 [Candidatus Latescibacterota bacterium]
MRNFKVPAFLGFVILSVFLAASCSDNEDSSTTGPGTSGNSTAGSLATHAGTNFKVTEANVDSVSETVTETTYEVFGKALAAAGSAKTAKTAIDIPLSGTANGSVSGHASVSGKYVVSSDYNTITYNFTCTFYDYSDDGKLYYGGSIVYTGTWVMSTEAYNLTFRGGLKFNGAYEGTQDFTTTYVYNMSAGSVNIQSTTSTTSGGQTFTSTYRYPE